MTSVEPVAISASQPALLVVTFFFCVFLPHHLIVGAPAQGLPGV